MKPVFEKTQFICSWISGGRCAFKQRHQSSSFPHRQGAKRQCSRGTPAEHGARRTPRRTWAARRTTWPFACLPVPNSDASQAHEPEAPQGGAWQKPEHQDFVVKTQHFLGQRLQALYAFTRPHTVRGTFLAAVTGCIRAIIDSKGELLARSSSEVGSRATPRLPWSTAAATLSGVIASLDWSLLPKALWGIVALVLGNAFIVGINQIYDQDVDRINKPFLPLAAGMMTVTQAWSLCLSAIALSIWIVYRNFSRAVLALYVIGTTMGALYSVPPFRWRNVPLLAALTIACVRGLLLNLGVYVATKEALKLQLAWTPALRLFVVIMSIFAGVIAVTKDLPDVEGDRLHQVPTFASQLGVANVARIASAALFAMYMSVAVMSLMPEMAAHFRVWVLCLGHLALGWHFLTQVFGRLMRLGPENIQALRAFYRGIWNLFYLEFLLYIFI